MKKKEIRPSDISKNSESKKFKFSYIDKEFDIAVEVNKNVIDFYDDYPQTNLDVYFKASISADSGNSMLNGLKPIIQNESEGNAVNMLLRFVQNAFSYKTDDEQFGREKYFFPEETLFYPYSDCEDRSILFAFLVKNLLELDIVGLEYPGHAATAVKFSTIAQGDYVNYNNVKYIICDPTYINANYGECMPQFKTVTPTVVPIRTF